MDPRCGPEGKIDVSLLFDRVCLETKTSLQRGFRRTVFVASTSNAGKARMAVAGVVPAGSFCDENGVWNVPDGSTIEVFRYADDIPDAYMDGPVAFHVCHGSDPLSFEEVCHVQRWRKALPSLAA